MNQFTKAVKSLAAKYNETSLILRIAIGLLIGAALALICPGAVWLEEFGSLFVGALKGIAPVLVFVIVASALAQGSSKLDRRFGTVVWLYMLTTFVAAALSVVTSKLFPRTLVLAEAATADVVPQGLGDVMHTLLANIVSNPVASIMNGNYIGGRGLHHRALDHQPGTVRHHGTGFRQCVGQRPVYLHSVWPPAAFAGRHYAADGAGHQSADHLHLSAPQSVPAGASLSA